MEWNGVEWILVEWDGVDGSMECSAVECNEWIDGMQCSGVEWNEVDGCSGWMIRTPNVHEQFDVGFFGQSDNFHFSKVAHFFLFARRVRKWPQKKGVPQN